MQAGGNPSRRGMASPAGVYDVMLRCSSSGGLSRSKRFTCSRIFFTYQSIIIIIIIFYFIFFKFRIRPFHLLCMTNFIIWDGSAAGQKSTSQRPHFSISISVPSLCTLAVFYIFMISRTALCLLHRIVGTRVAQNHFVLVYTRSP